MGSHTDGADGGIATVPARPRPEPVDGTIDERVARVDWEGAEAALWARGYAVVPPVLAPAECERLAASYDDDGLFRSRIDMARHRFGQGEYKYFADPLPDVVRALREALFRPLAGIANGWMEALGSDTRFPGELDAFRERCHAAGQTKPTPLLLRYEEGGYNCLHQDLYGEVAFPMQVVVPLNRREVDYTGGDFVLVEQRPRAQSAAEVVRPRQGELVIFTTRERPSRGTRGFHRVKMRHGVSRVRSGRRVTLGVIFHDAA